MLKAIWRVRGRERQAYSYAYDGLQRITSATYSDITDAGTVTATNRYNTSYTYADLRGNIGNNQRNGLYLDGVCYTQVLLDNMTYTYTSGTNKISSISDAGNITQGGFRASSGAFTYDVNGNQISNAAKGITSITYNHLNLPTNITLSGSRTIDFTYAADGMKLRKVVKTGATINLVQEYVNGIEYRGTAIPATTLEGIYHAEGRLYNNAGTWRREYIIKDHLGNTRIAYCDINNDGVIATPSEILQENNYDAFGYGLDGVYMNHSNPDNLYQYNGKEKNDDHGIGMYDYGARWMDPSIGRWFQIDPKTEKFFAFSGYNYALNDPIKFRDIDGRDVIISSKSSNFINMSLASLQSLTSDKLRISNGNVYISSFSSSGDKSVGTQLIRNLILGFKQSNGLTKTAYVVIEQSTGATGTDPVNNKLKRTAESEANSTNGKGSNSLISFNLENPAKDKIVTNDGSYTNPLNIGLAHELIHAENNTLGINQRSIPTSVKDQDDPQGKRTLSKEEVNVRNKENRIRDEQNVVQRKLD